MARSKSKNKHKQKHGHQQRSEGGSASEADDSSVNSPFIVGESSTVGRYLEAKRDLRAGELILTETPLVVGPSQDSKSLCVGCYCSLNLVESDIYRCPSCSFPLCSSGCSGNNKEYGHGALECSIMTKSATIKESKAVDLMGHLEAITPLRCLCLRTANPKAWEILNGMEAHTPVRQMVPTLWTNNQRNVVDVIRKQWRLEEFEEEIIHHVCGVLEVNAFEVGLGLRALYPTAYLFAHDCVPNTRHSDDAHFNATFWTSVPVQAGKMLTVTYTYILQGTTKRRKHLRDTKFFDCQCQRCTDPSELGTNMSAFKCPVCKSGLVESNQPLDPNANWSCKAAQCTGYVIEGSTVYSLTQRIFAELDATDGNDIPAFELFLEKYSTKLHSNHYLCLSALHCLFLLYGKIEGYLITELTEKQLLRKVEICQTLLDAFDKLEPGLSKQRGIIMYELQAPLMVLLQRQHQEKKIGKIEIKNKLKIISKYLEESFRILKVEPLGSQEVEMAGAAAEALESLATWKKLM